MSKISILKEFWDFIKFHKKFWMIPILVILLLIGLLIVLTEGSAITPFIYTLF
jgi:competence protein ComGC